MDRRSFLSLGQKLKQQSPWDSFRNRVRRFACGAWQDLPDSSDGYPQACLTIERNTDFGHALALAQEYHVALVLDGVNQAGDLIGRPGLWLRPSSQLAQIEELNAQTCMAGPATLVKNLLAKGYQQFEHVPPQLTLAHWFANPKYHDVRPGYSFLSGVERIHACFANGEQAVVGGFGVHGNLPLSVSILQRAIPNLFELLSLNLAVEAFATQFWPFAYRFDALKKNLIDSNIARVFLGHGGTLVWVQSFVLRKISPDYSQLETQQKMDLAGDTYLIQDIDTRIKGLFDPNGVFPYWDEVTFPKDF